MAADGGHSATPSSTNKGMVAGRGHLATGTVRCSLGLITGGCSSECQQVCFEGWQGRAGGPANTMYRSWVDEQWGLHKVLVAIMCQVVIIWQVGNYSTVCQYACAVHHGHSTKAVT